VFEKSFQFLRQLKENNRREWYHAHKALFNEAKQEFEHVTELLLYEVSRFDKNIAGLQTKDCIYRIFRDIRFSTNKSPYKTNFGTFLVPGGRKSMNAGYYLHIEPGGSFIASGNYQPPSPILTAIRKDIFTFTDEFKNIINSKEIKELFGDINGEKLKTQPRGFSRDFPDIELLKFKSYGLIRMKSDDEMMHADILQEIVKCFRASLPFITFINEAIKDVEK